GAAATATVASSPYAITASAALGSGLSNYTISYTSGTLTVNKAPLTVTAASVSRSYGTANPSFTVSYSGLVNGETAAVLSGSPSLTTTATPSSPPGAYPITIGPGSLAAVNYTFTFVPGTLTVNPALLTASGVDVNATAG